MGDGLMDQDRTCVVCARLARPPSDDGIFVAALSESIAILADDQFYPGYCILMLKDHHEQLAQLPAPRQARLWSDVAAVATALTAVCAPPRLNYECLGNLAAHIHWHVVPRYADDERRHEPIWVRPAEERRGSASPAQRRALVARLRTALAAQAASLPGQG